jgi:hypothetical protein
MDRYTRGEACPTPNCVTCETTRLSRRVTTPIREVIQIYRAIRDINATLPRDRQLRGLFGDPRIDGRTSTRARTFRNESRCGIAR